MLDPGILPVIVFLGVPVRLSAATFAGMSSVISRRTRSLSWAFEPYATGDYMLSQLADELRSCGLTHRPTANRARARDPHPRATNDWSPAALGAHPVLR